MTSPTFEVSGSVVAFATDGTATSFSVVPEALTFEVVNVAGYTVAVTALDELSDVNTSGVSNGDALVYDSGTWVPGASSGGGTASVVLTGDVLGTAVAGTVTADIADSGVAAGTYGSSGTAVVVTVAADGRITSISGTAIAGGGSSLPDPTGNEGAGLVVDTGAWVAGRAFTSPDGKSRVIFGDGSASIEYVDGAAYSSATVDPTGAEVFATNGTATAQVRANQNGTVEISASAGTDILVGDLRMMNGDPYWSWVHDGPSVGPGQYLIRRRVGPAAVEVDDALGYPGSAMGYDGTDDVYCAEIAMVVDGTVSTGIVPARVVVSTMDAAGTLTERIRHSSDGTTDITGSLTVNGSPVSGGGGGGLVLIDSGTFSAASSVSLPNGSFSSTYDDYKLIFVPTAFSTTGPVATYLRFRDSGSDDTSSIYAYARGYSYNGGGGDDGAVSADAIMIGNSSGPPLHRSSMDITSPNLAEITSVIASTTMDQGTGYFILTYVGAHVRSTTQYDALTIYPNTGTITGRWALYGYAK